MLALFLQISLAILVFLFIIHAWIENRASNKQKTATPQIQKQSPPDSAFTPTVTILLPVYNEQEVVARLLNSICALVYPSEKLEILLLDDSNDNTGEIADAIIAREQKKGLNIRRLRHKKSRGFKAANLKYGLCHAKGEFIAIFDADCLPPPDFLQSSMPFFQNGKIGFLQTGIKYHNADSSFLTRFQAAEAAHKEQVTTGFSAEGHMASLTGSSCIWRRKCIDDIGGISSATITEDVDMGYAAQLRNWHYHYTTKIHSLAELPETMAAFRVQRQRWARGLVHNAMRHMATLFRSDMNPFSKLHALALVFSPLLLALFYALLLLSPFIALATPHLGVIFHLLCSAFLVTTIFWAWLNTSPGSQQDTDTSSRITFTIAYVLLFFPLSLYYFSAILHVILLGKGEFHTTPKGCGRKKLKHPQINRILLGLEIGSLLWSLGTMILSIHYTNYWTLLYSSLATGGFSMVLYFSIKDWQKKYPGPTRILITGASGSLGAALAEEYAAPGIHLILLGQNSEKLQKVAQNCRAKGASSETQILDLRDTEEVHAWASNLSETEIPDLLIANAGLNTNIGTKGQGEPYEKTIDLVKVNFLSVMALVNGILPGMRKRGNGQIALISSLAALYGLPHTPVYSATKAALKTWGQALRGLLSCEGIRVNVVMPGYIASPMCDAMPGPKPFLWTAKKAAKKIHDGLEHDRAFISFPFPLNLGIWALGLLPQWLASAIIRLLGYGR